MKLPVISGADAVTALRKMAMNSTNRRAVTSLFVTAIRRIEDYPFRITRKGTLRALIRQAGLTIDEFHNLL